jgi:ABC-type Zn uptake system ZnuABC Zn-binding protein ZnuA
MSITIKHFNLLGLLVALMLVAACGAQPEPAAQNSGSSQEAAVADEDHHDEEAGNAHNEEEHAEDEHDEDAEAHHDEEDEHEHDEGAEAHHDEDEHEHDEDAEAHHDEDEHDHEGDRHDEAVELSAVDLAEGEKLKVVATTNIIGDLVRNVGDDTVELTTMLPVGADPHTFNPTPQDAALVADAHVVLINGLHLEEFLEELIENAGGEAAVVTLSNNVETREFEAGEGHAHGDEEGDHHDEEEHEDDAHEDEHGHAHEGADPHIWMTPANAMVMVHNIEHALSELDPANAESYEANAEAYEAQLEELDAWVMEQISAIPEENREMVTDHEAFGYYADRYGLDIVGTVIPSTSTNAEPSAQELAELQEEIGKLDVRAVFVGTTVNPVLAERVAEDTGIELVPLYTGSLGEANSGVETYLDFIRYNTTAIVDGLK